MFPTSKCASTSMSCETKQECFVVSVPFSMSAELVFLGVFQEQEDNDAEQQTSDMSLAAEEACEHFHQRRVFLELELQDGKVKSASKMINSMKVLFSLARKGGLPRQADIWEQRIDEIESIRSTSGKGPAISYAWNALG